MSIWAKTEEDEGDEWDEVEKEDYVTGYVYYPLHWVLLLQRTWILKLVVRSRQPLMSFGTHCIWYLSCECFLVHIMQLTYPSIDTVVCTDRAMRRPQYAVACIRAYSLSMAPLTLSTTSTFSLLLIDAGSWFSFRSEHGYTRARHLIRRLSACDGNWSECT